jgi:hypothetical protein
MGQLRWSKIPRISYTLDASAGAFAVSDPGTTQLKTTTTGGASGSVQFNVPPDDAFINFAKMYQSQQFHAGSSPADLDDNQYPKNALGGAIFGSIVMSPTYAPNGVSFVLKNTGTRQFRCALGANVTVTSSSGGATYTGGSNSNLTATFAGAGKIYFTFNNYTSTEIGFNFPTGYTNVTGTGELVLCRGTSAYLSTDDEYKYDNGEYFTKEYLDLLRDLNPKTIRTCGWNNQAGQGSNHTKFAHRTTLSFLAFNDNWPSGAWGGTASTLNNIAYTCSNPTDSNAGAYVDGEIIQLRWPNADNANSAPTLNRGSLGAKGMVDRLGNPLTASFIPANSLASFVYDALLGKFICTPGIYYESSPGSGIFIAAGGGLTYNIPIEYMVQLANRLNANLWFSMPVLWDDASVTSCTTLIRDSLNPQLKCYFESGNEIWNPGFWSWHLFFQRGLALGFPGTGLTPVEAMYGLRVRQIMPLITAAWSPRSASTLKKVMPTSAIGDFAPQMKFDRFDGGSLIGSTYPLYLAYVGGVDPGYNVAGNRPIDVCDVISYAPYFEGANFAHLDGSYRTGSAALLQTAARNFVLGGASASTALNWLDNDIRAGIYAGTLACTISNGSPAVITVANTFSAYDRVVFSNTGGALPTGITAGAQYYVNPTGLLTSSFGIMDGGLTPINTTSNGSGTHSVGGLLSAGTLLGMKSAGGVYPIYEGIAASYDSGRAIPLTVEAYEGGLQAWAPSTYTCTRLGITANYLGSGLTNAGASAALTDLLLAYKTDTTAYSGKGYGYQLTFDYCTQYKDAAFPHSNSPSWLQITGPSEFSLMPGDIFSTPWTLYYGVKAFR